MPSVEVARYRGGTASQLAQSVLMTGELERRLGVDDELRETSTQSDLETDPAAPLRAECALLLRKARLHSDAVLRANAAGNLHSLAVQMRPVLECAGQVVFICHNHFVAPRLATDPGRAVRALDDRISADFYGTMIRATKGKMGHEQLLAILSDAEGGAAESLGMRAPERRRRKSLKQEDKASTLVGGEAWYAHLSKRFCHGEGDLRGAPWRGGVKSMNTWRDELAFAGFMDCLVEQVNTMNAHAALCPAAGGRRTRVDRGDAGATNRRAQDRRRPTECCGVDVCRCRRPNGGLMRAAAEGVEQQRIRCGELRDLLREFAGIHVRIDTPDRMIGADTPDWILRLRKVCLHVLAISECNVDVEGVHTMATELRAAYRQMHAVWPCVPPEHRVVGIDWGWWDDEARNRLLATYDHPTPVSLMLPLTNGGFDEFGEAMTYVRLVVWLGSLELGYAAAIDYLAEVMKVDRDLDSEVTELLQRSARIVQDKVPARFFYIAR